MCGTRHLWWLDISAASKHRTVTHRATGYTGLEMDKTEGVFPVWCSGPDSVLPQDLCATRPEPWLPCLEEAWALPVSSACLSKQGRELLEWEGCVCQGCREDERALDVKYMYFSILTSVSPPAPGSPPGGDPNPTQVSTPRNSPSTATIFPSLHTVFICQVNQIEGISIKTS